MDLLRIIPRPAPLRRVEVYLDISAFEILWHVVALKLKFQTHKLRYSSRFFKRAAFNSFIVLRIVSIKVGRSCVYELDEILMCWGEMIHAVSRGLR